MPWLKGRRPEWLIRLGLFLYDHLGGPKVLPPTARLDLTTNPAGKLLKPQYVKAFEYSDCRVEDSRLVAMSARDAARRGARILTQTRVTHAAREGDLWAITTEDATGQHLHHARAVVNAAGPFVSTVMKDVLPTTSTEGVRLVRGSHIVTRKLYDHDRCYFFQGADGRIIFAIPYERDFTLLGTTDADHTGAPGEVKISDTERDYLLTFANQYFRAPLSEADIVWTYSGVRPLYDDGAKSATAATRDYVLSLDTAPGQPQTAAILNIFGGKITTHRRLAEHALDKLAPFFPAMKPGWTARVPLPGGDFPLDDKPKLIADLRAKHPYLRPACAERMIKAYGLDAFSILGDSTTAEALGHDFGAILTEAELRWLMKNEFARHASDVIWRMSKLGLRMTPEEVEALEAWMQSAQSRCPSCHGKRWQASGAFPHRPNRSGMQRDLVQPHPF
jgi:glycerol-3-phosphate dehydrogenase